MKNIFFITLISLFSLSSLFAALTTREDINFLQDESDYNITQRSHIKEYQELSKTQSFWHWLIFG